MISITGRCANSLKRKIFVDFLTMKIETRTRNSSRMKYFARATSASLADDVFPCKRRGKKPIRSKLLDKVFSAYEIRVVTLDNARILENHLRVERRREFSQSKDLVC